MKLALLLATVLLSGCTAKLYHANGQLAAAIPWPQEATMRTADAEITVKPGEGTVPAAQATVLGVTNNAPGLVVSAINAYQNTQKEK